MTDAAGPSRPSYTEALDELEAILAELERGEVDIDRLAGQVRRAAELLAVCRGRLDEARTEVERVVLELEPDGAGQDDER